jgi:hypothetical protein
VKKSRRSPVLLALVAVVLAHGALLAASVADYRVTIDSAYHVSLGRYYGEHGAAWWDHINFGPRGRPNLQGPLLHAAIGLAGRLLGGHGPDYVLANSLLAVIQWLAAITTVAFFAWQIDGQLAALFAVALLSGAACASTSFAVGIPSGWLFIVTPWAIWFFLRDYTLLAAIATAAGIYVHFGGYLTTPVGILVAAALTGRWRRLFICGIETALVTLPYSIHLIRYTGWLSGMKSHSALLFDPMLDLLAIGGSVRFFRRPRAHPFMVAWLLAPIAWLFQDAGRFILQWPLGGSVAAGLFLAERLRALPGQRSREWSTAAIIAAASLFPFGPPALGAELSWIAGNHYPRPVSWNAAQSIADQIERAGLGNLLVADYSPALCPALAVYAPITCDKGHWIEVQPPFDPADNISVAAKVYILPLAPDDPALRALAARGWLEVHGGYNDNVVVSFARRPSIDQAVSASSQIIAAQSQWLCRYAINNFMSYDDWRRAISPKALAAFRRDLAIQRIHAGRLQLGWLIYAWALEPMDADGALTARRVAGGAGLLASLLGDDLALNFITTPSFAHLKLNLLALAHHSRNVSLAMRNRPDNDYNLLMNTAWLERYYAQGPHAYFPGRK